MPPRKSARKTSARSASPARKKSASPARKKSASPARKKSASPARKKSASSARKKSASPARRAPAANDFVRITWAGDGGHDCILLVDEEGDLIPHPVDESWHDPSLVFHPKEDTWSFLTGAELDAAKEQWAGDQSDGDSGASPSASGWLKLAAVVAVVACAYGFNVLSTTAEAQAAAGNDDAGQ